jgi:hypothetical protein
MIEQGIVPDNVEEAFSMQVQLLAMLLYIIAVTLNSSDVSTTTVYMVIHASVSTSSMHALLRSRSICCK